MTHRTPTSEKALEAMSLEEKARNVARRLVGYEPDYDISNEEAAMLLEEMLRMAKNWRRARDYMRRLDDGGQ